MKTNYISLALFLALFTACSNEATLDENYWETIEAGAYKFTEAKITTYVNGTFKSDSLIDIGKSYIVLETTNYAGFHNHLSFYGDWNLYFKSRTPDGWNMENDSKRLTFASNINGNVEATATLTIENVGKKKQIWHFVDGNATTYIHYTYSLERTSKPN